MVQNNRSNLPVKKTWIPEIVDPQGNKLSGPDMESVTSLVSQFSQLAQLARINKNLSRKHIQGKKVTLVRDATDQLGVIDLTTLEPYIPNIPWAKLTIANQGPAIISVSINDFWDYTDMWPNSHLDFDYSDADERIHLVTYRCKPGGTASIQLVATY